MDGVFELLKNLTRLPAGYCDSLDTLSGSVRSTLYQFFRKGVPL
jgi:hypothetical protein